MIWLGVDVGLANGVVMNLKHFPGLHKYPENTTPENKEPYFLVIFFLPLSKPFWNFKFFKPFSQCTS